MGNQIDRIVRAETLMDKCYDALLNFMLELKPGENKLPSEGELAQLLGVSRTTVREALSRLSAEGLVTKIPNRGYFAHRSVAKLQNRIDLFPDFYQLLNRYYGNAKLEIEMVSKRPMSPKCHLMYKHEEQKATDVYAMRWIYSSNGTRFFVGDLEFATDYFVKDPSHLSTVIGLPDFSNRFMEHPITHCTMTLSVNNSDTAYEALKLEGDPSPVLCWNEAIYNMYDDMVGCGIFYINPDAMSLTVNASLMRG